MSISTGSSIEEQSGSITIDVGTTTNGPGSNIDIWSGQTLDEEQKGGSTVILGGDGSGGGGSLIMSGGIDLSTDEESATVGGEAVIKGGTSTAGSGGSVRVFFPWVVTFPV